MDFIRLYGSNRVFKKSGITYFSLYDENSQWFIHIEYTLNENVISKDLQYKDKLTAEIAFESFCKQMYVIDLNILDDEELAKTFKQTKIIEDHNK